MCWVLCGNQVVNTKHSDKKHKMYAARRSKKKKVPVSRTQELWGNLLVSILERLLKVFEQF